MAVYFSQVPEAHGSFSSYWYFRREPAALDIPFIPKSVLSAAGVLRISRIRAFCRKIIYGPPRNRIHSLHVLRPELFGNDGFFPFSEKRRQESRLGKSIRLMNSPFPYSTFELGKARQNLFVSCFHSINTALKRADLPGRLIGISIRTL